MNYWGDYAANAVVRIPWDSFAAATGAPAATTNFANTDIQIYKNGNTTQRASANGITVSTSFDGSTGLQLVEIDLSDNTTAGFYAAGNDYLVAVADVTVDGQTLRFWLGGFSILRRDWDTTIRGAVGMASANLDTAIAGVNTNIDANETKINAIKTKTDFLPSATAGAAGGVFIAGTNAATSVSITGNITGNLSGSVGSVTGAVGSVSGNVSGNVVGSIGSVATGGIVSGSFGAGALDGVWSTATRVLTAGTNIQLPSNGLANVTAWTVAITGNITGNLSGSVGSVTGAVGSIANGGIVAATFAANALDAVWSTAARTLTAWNFQLASNALANITAWTVAITGNITGNLSGSVGSVTGNVGGNVTGSVGSVSGNVGGNVVGSVGSVTGLTASNLDATISSRATPAQVNTEVLDVMTVDTFAEPGQAAPAATSTLATKIGYLYKAWRNRHTQTASTFSLYADDATTVDQKATVSDDGTTFDRAEIGSGP